MICISVMYPGREGGTFDVSYYCQTHMRMVRELAAGRVKRITVEEAVSAGPPSPYVAIGRLFCDSMADWQIVSANHGRKFMEDIPNFTNLQPVIQISEVVTEI